MSTPETDPDLASLSTLLDLLQHAEFRRSFLNDPRGTAEARGADGVGQHLLNVLADLSYEELSLLGRVGSELKVVLGPDASGFMF